MTLDLLRMRGPFSESVVRERMGMKRLVTAKDAIAQCCGARWPRRDAFYAKGRSMAGHRNSGAMRFIACDLFSRMVREQLSKDSGRNSIIVSLWAAASFRDRARQFRCIALNDATNSQPRLSCFPGFGVLEKHHLVSRTSQQLRPGPVLRK
jgi:hypothetical protein